MAASDAPVHGLDGTPTTVKKIIGDGRAIVILFRHCL
jgi:hypothetical protein